MAVIFSQDDLNRIGTMLDGVTSLGEALMAVDKTIAMAEGVMGNMGGLVFEDSWVTQAKKDIANYIGQVQTDAKQLQGDRTSAVPDGWATVKTDIWGLWSYAQLVQGEFPPDSQTMLARVQDAISGAADDLAEGIAQAPKYMALELSAVGDAASGVIGAVGDAAAKVAGAAGGAAAKTIWQILAPFKWPLIGVGVLLVGTVALVFFTDVGKTGAKVGAKAAGV